MMRDEKNIVALDDYEQGIMIKALNELRTRLINEERSTDAVDDMILNTANARCKRVRYTEREENEPR